MTYQNHFYLQEQDQLFLLSGDWLATYFDKPAWAACMVGDFLTQFYYYTYAGQVILAVVLLVTAWSAYLGLRWFAGKWLSLAFAVATLLLLVFSSFDTYFRLSSAIAVVGGFLCYGCLAVVNSLFTTRKVPSFVVKLACFLLAFWLFGFGMWITVTLVVVESLVKRSNIPLTLASLLGAIVVPLAMQYRYDLHFADCASYPGISEPTLPESRYEQTLDVENTYYFGNYNGVTAKVRAIGNPNKIEKIYYYLAQAKRGMLADNLLTLDNPDLGTLTTINDKTPRLVINVMNDLYYTLGDMMYAERAAMLANVFSPQNRNVKYTKRLAETNLVSGDTLAAMKYLRLLSQTLVYRQWAKDHTPGTMTDRVAREILAKRKMQNMQDTLRIGDNCRTILLELLDSNVDNVVALDYLLCTDLLLKDMDNFKADYDRYCIANGKPRIKPIYQQALMIWLAGTDAPDSEWNKYIVDPSQARRFREYNAARGSIAFKGTYWYYFDKAKQ